jgi:hypothetical protein
MQKSSTKFYSASTRPKRRRPMNSSSESLKPKKNSTSSTAL